MNENVLLMKRLLRSGWIRTGVPTTEIESLADHSWAVAVYAYFFCIQENYLRTKGENTLLNVEKTILMALFHDFLESEYMDIDKSINNIITSDKIEKFIQEVENNALKMLISRMSQNIGTSLESLFKDQDCEEYQLVKIADYYDLLVQARYYFRKHWISEKDSFLFSEHALKKLEPLFNRFLFLESHLDQEGFLD